MTQVESRIRDADLPEGSIRIEIRFRGMGLFSHALRTAVLKRALNCVSIPAEPLKCMKVKGFDFSRHPALEDSPFRGL